MTKHVFISYARADGRIYANRIWKILKDRGYDPWLDERDIDPYQDFTDEIEKAIEQSDHVVVCLTPIVAERKDSFVRREIIYAQNNGKPITPLVLPGFSKAKVPVHIDHLTYLEVTDFVRDMERLVNRIENDEHVERSQPKDPFEQYLRALYKQILKRLDDTAVPLITLRSRETPGVVQTALPVKVYAEPLSRKHSDEKVERQTEREFVSFHEAFHQKDFRGRVLLLGEPGAGKSTTLWAFARDAVVNRLDDSTAPLPLLAEIPTWLQEEMSGTLAEWLCRVISGVNKADIDAVLFTDGALLLLDGLDELGGEREDPKTKEKFDPRQRFLSLLPANNQVIVSCRSIDYDEIGQKAALDGAVTLRLLDDRQIQDYLSDQPDLWAVLEVDNDLREIARTPLLLSLFAFAFNGLDEKAKKLHSLSRGDLRDKIFETYVQRRYEHESQKRQLSYSLEQIVTALGLAIIDNGGTFHFLPNTISITRLGQDANTFIAECRLLHFIVPISDIHFRFIHLLLRDYFAFRIGWRELSNANARVRMDAAVALGQCRDARAVPRLLLVLNDADIFVRDYGIRRLLKVIRSEPMQKLMSKFGLGWELGVRGSVAQALGYIGDPKALPGLLAALNDFDWFVRSNAAIAIGQLGDVNAVEKLLILLDDKDLNVRTSIIETLVEIDDVRAVEPLIRLLNSPVLNDMDNIVHRRTAEALGELGDVRAVESLVAALSDANAGTRYHAAQALEQIGSQEALAAVKAGRKDIPSDYDPYSW